MAALLQLVTCTLLVSVVSELYVPERGQQRVVGQGGPELFVPEADGHIIPNHKLNFAGGRHSGGSVTTTSRSDGSHSHPEKDNGTMAQARFVFWKH